MGADDEAEQERLRRRLYAPGANAADIEAYRAVETEVVPEESAPPPRRRNRVPLLVGAAVLVAAGVTGLVVTRPGPTPAPSPTPTVRGELAVPAADRARFLQELDAGRDPNLLAYLDAHPSLLLTRLRADGRADSSEYTGTGSVSVPLSPTTSEERAGHFTLVLVLDRDVGYEWQATSLQESNDRSGPEPPVASYEGTADRGAPVSGTVGYSGGVPTRLTLLLPTGTRWAAVVVYTD